MALWLALKSLTGNPPKRESILDFFIDLGTGIFSVPLTCTIRLQDKLDIVLNSNYTTAKELASISVTLISMGSALGLTARLWIRPFTTKSIHVNHGIEK